MVNTTYFLKEDLESSIRDHRLEHILDHEDDNNSVDAFQQATNESIALIKDYLFNFQIEEELQKTGDDRHFSIVFYIKNICLYIIYKRIEDYEVPDRVIKDYEETIATLDEIAKGKLPISLPLKGEDTDGDGEIDSVRTKFRWGSERKRRYY